MNVHLEIVMMGDDDRINKNHFIPTLPPIKPMLKLTLVLLRWDGPNCGLIQAR